VVGRLQLAFALGVGVLASEMLSRGRSVRVYLRFFEHISKERTLAIRCFSVDGSVGDIVIYVFVRLLPV